MLDKVKKLNYSDYSVPLLDFDANIAAHVYIDACNGSIVRHVIESLVNLEGARILDVGCGSGQVSRLFGGLTPAVVEACDIDPEVAVYFRENPETSHIHYFEHDVVSTALPKYYDVAVLRGVYHHIPKSDRVSLLKRLLEKVDTIIIADEGILEYRSERERLEYCQIWYSFVIREAERRGLHILAEMERRFLDHEDLSSADDGGDLKESPECLVAEVAEAGAVIRTLDRLGSWEANKGGFYTAVITN